ncbi:hypothetical protein [Achromobacter xylosoxidans]|uniref:hypothetical protein n=1 Tax=Alcaligenes xylosoxydans xylosoxydans TaxID=85698 RepID=UPI001040E875|nr:hypothetical protein [Achromobacter xylosoxidans]MCH4595208.1 hypothetical protein [Achromobacter xylosoxidans]
MAKISIDFFNRENQGRVFREWKGEGRTGGFGAAGRVMQGGRAAASLASSRAGNHPCLPWGNKRPASVGAPDGARMLSHRFAGSHAGRP